MKQKIETANAPGAIGPYSQGTTTGNVVFTSGQLPIDVKSGKMEHEIEKQTEQSLENVKAVLEAAGASMADVVKTTVFIKHMDEFAKINEVYAKYFEAPFPARSCVEVARLPKDAKIEIEAIAIKG